jgi:t-SNARE complex subunit (syntaxin)
MAEVQGSVRVEDKQIKGDEENAGKTILRPVQALTYLIRKIKKKKITLYNLTSWTLCSLEDVVTNVKT